MAEAITSDDLPIEDQAFHVEQHGIDFIPESERWATARNIGALWAGSALNVEYFIYGALLMGFGFSFWTALWLILLGNLSFLLLGVASLQGPQTGTTAFSITRAPFGSKGGRILAFFNWITQLGFETEGLILIVGAVIVLCQMGGLHINDTWKVIFVILAAAIQAVLPYLGHATMVKVLRALIVPFALLFVVMAIFDGKHATTRVFTFGSGWELFLAGLAFVIALSGLGWTECGNDYTRYCPPDTKKSAIIGWVFVATALPEIVMMILGALTYSFLSNSNVWNGANPFEAFRHQHAIPSWFVVIFLVFAVIQLFGINSLDLYSSGVSLQAMGLRLKRYQAVIVDSVIAGLLTIYAVFGSTFSIYMKEFVGVIIVWIAPWLGIFLTDWLLRKMKYSAPDLQRTDKDGLYYGQRGYNWNAISAFAIGLVCSTMAYSKAPPPSNFPFHWMTPISNHFGAACAGKVNSFGVCKVGWYGGADFSIWIGIGVAALVYLGLEWLNHYVAVQLGKKEAPVSVNAAKAVAGGWMAIAGGATLLLGLGFDLGINGTVNTGSVMWVYLVALVLGASLVGTGAATAYSKSDHYRDLTTGLGVLTVLWGVFAYGFAHDIRGVGYPAGGYSAWAIIAAGIIAIVARTNFPVGAQTKVDG